MHYLKNIIGHYCLTICAALGGLMAFAMVGYHDTMAFVIVSLCLSTLLGEKITQATSEKQLTQLFLVCVLVDLIQSAIICLQVHYDDSPHEWMGAGIPCAAITIIIGCWALMRQVEDRTRQFDGEFFFVEGVQNGRKWRACWCPSCNHLLEEHAAGCQGGARCTRCRTVHYPTGHSYGFPESERYWLEMLSPPKPAIKKSYLED